MPYLPEGSPTWPQSLHKQFGERRSLEPFTDFLYTIDRLDIKPIYIHGNIAVIGQGPLFPERTLLCKDKHLDSLKPAISLLVCCDTAYLSSPDVWGFPTINGPDASLLPSLPKGSIVHYSWGASYIYKDMPDELFETVFAFQLPNLAQQLKDGLLDAVARVIKPGGHFVGSGGVVEGYYDKLESNKDGSMDIIQRVMLPNPGSAGTYNEHVGVIMQKK